MPDETTAALIAEVLGLARKALAELTGSVHVQHYRVANAVMRVTASSTLARRDHLGSLNGLRIGGITEPPDFEILLLDDHDAAGSRSALDRVVAPAAGRFLSVREEKGLVACAVIDEGIVQAADLTRRTAVCWLRGSGLEPPPARPFQVIVHWWMTPRGCQPVHAGAIGDERGAVLVAGPKGCGKSTLCLRLLAGGMNYFGDDFVLVGPGNAARDLSVFNLYSWARIHELPPELARHVPLACDAIAGELKLTLPLDRHFGEQIGKSAPLRAVIYPVVSQRTGRPRRMSKVHALRQMMSTIGYLPGHEQHTMQNLTACVTRLPCYSLDVGEDITSTAAAIRQILTSTDDAVS
jgi:hypothetical protein